jgi:hypothetical protein
MSQKLNEIGPNEEQTESVIENINIQWFIHRLKAEEFIFISYSNSSTKIYFTDIIKTNQDGFC